MKDSLKYRSAIGDARRIVIKVGTRVLVHKTGRPDLRRIRALVKEIASLRKAGHEVALVTSGAVGTGMEALGMKTRPTRTPDLQMAAAVGQSRLMAMYDKLFTARKCLVGQVLLTHDNFKHSIRVTNVHRTMENLLRNEVIPIINENDVVSDEEIKADTALGDNDFLSALVANLIRADLLVILSTVDGLMDMSGSRPVRIRYVERITPSVIGLATGTKGALSKGGMASKLRAADMVSRAGASVVIADGRRPNVLQRIMRGDDVGTFILASV